MSEKPDSLARLRPYPIGWILGALVLALGVPFLIFLALTILGQASDDRDRAGQQMLGIARVAAARLDDHIGLRS